MSPFDFIQRWRNFDGNESSADQSFFLDLCALLGVAPPMLNGDYCFEKAVTKNDGNGRADVYRAGHFVVELKSPGRDLSQALSQATGYSAALNNPPVLIVSDFHSIEVHTRWNNFPSVNFAVTIDQLVDQGQRERLRWALAKPEEFAGARGPQELLDSARQAYRPPAPIPTVDFRSERDRVFNFLGRVKTHLRNLQIWSTRSEIPASDFLALRGFDAILSPWASNGLRSLHYDFQAHQDGIIRSIKDLTACIERYYINTTGVYVLEEPFPSGGKLRETNKVYREVVDRINDLYGLLNRSATVYPI